MNKAKYCKRCGAYIPDEQSACLACGYDKNAGNTKFEFLYRDASNYKTHNQFVLSGTLTESEVEEIFACTDGGDFIAEQVGLSHSFPGEICEDDHAFCELYDDGNRGFSTTDCPPTVKLSAGELLQRFRAAKGNWDCVKYDPAVYDPAVCYA